MIYIPCHNIPEVKMPAWQTTPQGIFIPIDHYYNANNANNKRKKGNKK